MSTEQRSVHIDTSRESGGKETSPGFDGQGFSQGKLESMCSTNYVESEERWKIENVYKLKSHKQNHYQVHISFAKDG
jgi:hypothetical protein